MHANQSFPARQPPPELSVVIPFFEEKESLEPLLAELRAVLEAGERSFEVLLVDDGSTDSGAERAAGLTAGDRRFRILRLDAHRGQSAALAAGLRRAGGRIVVTMDADLQNDPRDIPRLVELLKDHDLVSGVRTERRDSWVRRLSSRVANRVRSALLGDGITDVGCSLKAYRAELLAEVPVFDGMHRFLPALMKMAGARVVELPVGHRPRPFGTSKYGIHNRLWRGLADLLAVKWLQRRWIDLRRVEEIDRWTRDDSGSPSASSDRRSSSAASSCSGSPRNGSTRA